MCARLYAYFYSYIAGSFGSNINSQVQTIYRETGVHGSAMPVDIFINLAQDYADSGYDHKVLKRIFSVDREVQLSDIGSAYKKNRLYSTSDNYGAISVAEPNAAYGEIP